MQKLTILLKRNGQVFKTFCCRKPEEHFPETLFLWQHDSLYMFQIRSFAHKLPVGDLHVRRWKAVTRTSHPARDAGMKALSTARYLPQPISHEKAERTENLLTGSRGRAALSHRVSHEPEMGQVSNLRWFTAP